MHKYRTHKCNQLRYEDVKETVRLSGWVHRKRDHGQLIFIDLRDHYGLTQVVVDSSNTYFSIVENISLESVITITGTVVKRSDYDEGYKLTFLSQVPTFESCSSIYLVEFSMTHFDASIAEQIWDMKYRFKEGDGTPIDDTVEDSWRRIAGALASVEDSPKQWENFFLRHYLILNFCLLEE